VRPLAVTGAAICLIAAAAASSSDARRVPNRYFLTLTGTMHVQSEDVFDCDPGTARDVEDSTMRISTLRPTPVWVSRGGSDPPPPPQFRGANAPGIYGFGDNGYMTFFVTTSVFLQSQVCDEPARRHRCNVNGRTDGRFEAPGRPARMYLVEGGAGVEGGHCHPDAHLDFLTDLSGDGVFATVPLGTIVAGRTSTFGAHLHQRRKTADGPTVTLDLDWNVEIASTEGVVAVASASSPVRGGRVTLDGSRSFTRIRSYSWKLARGADCPPEVRMAPEALSGKRVSFPALCSFRATLTVENEHDSDSKTIAVQVRPRPWKTPFSTAPEGRLDSRLVFNALPLGRNVCAFDGLTGDQTSSHILHRSGAGGAHALRGGFTLAQVTTGPFKGNFYVAGYRTKVRRASLISKDLFPPSDLYSTNQAAGHLADLVALRSSVRDHENLHSTLIANALARDDLATKIEKMAAGSEGALEDRANGALVELETALTEATSEAKVKARMRARWSQPATILVRDGSGGFVSRTFPSLALLGDESP
jgi:hypothetical protein